MSGTPSLNIAPANATAVHIACDEVITDAKAATLPLKSWKLTNLEAAVGACTHLAEILSAEGDMAPASTLIAICKESCLEQRARTHAKAAKVTATKAKQVHKGPNGEKIDGNQASTAAAVKAAAAAAAARRASSLSMLPPSSAPVALIDGGAAALAAAAEEAKLAVKRVKGVHIKWKSQQVEGREVRGLAGYIAEHKCKNPNAKGKKWKQWSKCCLTLEDAAQAYQDHCCGAGEPDCEENCEAGGSGGPPPAKKQKQKKVGV